MAAKKPLISLLKGWPNPALLPTNLLQKAAASALSDQATAVDALTYAPDLGFQPLRENVATWLSSFYRPREPIPADRIAITGGASQSMGVLLQVYTDPAYTRNVWIVAPAYMLAFRIMDDAGLYGRLRAVPEDDEGVDIEYLRLEMSKSEERAMAEGNHVPKFKPFRPWNKFYKHVIYAVPTFSNPSSRTMSVRRREQLVRVAREFDALIITDDVYDFLSWPDPATASASGEGASSSAPPTETSAGAVPPRIVDVDRYLDGGAERSGADGFGNAVSNGSFSKICGPGMRTGWIEGTSKFAWGASQAGTSRSGGAPSQVGATLLAELLSTSALQTHIRSTLVPAYARRHARLVRAIHDYLLPLNITLAAQSPSSSSDASTAATPTAGGYFVWLTLPPTLSGAAVAQRAQETENLIVAPGDIFEVPAPPASSPLARPAGAGEAGRADAAVAAAVEEVVRFRHHVRLCFAWEGEDELEEGVRRLAAVVREMLEEEGERGDGRVSEKQEREMQF